MIKANELRIGNYIGTDFDDKAYQLILIGEGTTMLFYIKGDGGYIKDENAEPIPLTPEWLLKLGFEIDRKYCMSPDDYSYLIRVPNKKSRASYFRVYYEKDKTKREIHFGRNKGEFQVYASDMFVVSVESVHQLQNLYFALTGEELTIKK